MKLITRTLTPLLLAAILAGSTSTPHVARAADAPAAKPNPALQADAGKAAYQLLKDSAAAYRALDSYSSQILSVDHDEAEAQRGRVLWQRPDKLMAEVKDSALTERNFLNGDTLTQLAGDGDGMSYSVRKVGANKLEDALGRLGSGWYLSALLSGNDPLAPYGVSLEPFVKALTTRAANADDAKNLDEKADALHMWKSQPKFRMATKFGRALSFIR